MRLILIGLERRRSGMTITDPAAFITANTRLQPVPHAPEISLWLADEVTLEGETATFVWGDPLREHDTHTATVIEMVKNSHIRLHWDSSDSDAYWEIRMFHSEIAGNYHLAVTDFTEDDEPEDLVRIWDQNIERLHRITGV